MAAPGEKPLGILGEGVRPTAPSAFDDIVVDDGSDLVEEDGVDLRQAIVEIFAYRRLPDSKPLGGLPDCRTALDCVASFGPDPIRNVLPMPPPFAEQWNRQQHSSYESILDWFETPTSFLGAMIAYRTKSVKRQLLFPIFRFLTCLKELYNVIDTEYLAGSNLPDCFLK
jgi:hypothetical protein